MKTPTLFSLIIAHLTIFSSIPGDSTSGREQTVSKWDPTISDVVSYPIVLKRCLNVP